MKKIILTKTNPIVHKSADNSVTTLLDRKSMLGNYKKLFEALFDLPDKKVVARVLDAINNAEKHSPNIEVVQICSKCNRKTLKAAFVDASTQTEGKIIMQHTSTGNGDHNRDTTPTPSTTFKALNAVKQDETAPISSKTVAPIKRKRRRKTQIPHVIKKSQAQEQLQRNKPMLQKRKAVVLKTDEGDDKKQQSVLTSIKRQRLDSVSSSKSFISDLLEDEMLEGMVTLDDIKDIMADEWIKAEFKDEDGLYPIHSAIVKSDSKFLERQILVWKKLKHTDLNEIFTDNDEDCLQLAVSENSSPEIVKILLVNGLDTDCRDENSNTIVHLAILNEVSPDVLKLLVEKIDLKSLFVLNYDGYTPLHLAVRQNEYLLAEAFLDTLDERLLGKSHYEREKVPDEKNTKENTKKFLKYYESCCERYKLQQYLGKYSKENLIKKRKLMDAGDICGGTTVLLFAIENKLEHLIYFLLAHFSDPGAESLSGQSPASFMNEFAKCLNLSLRIDKVMENVVSLLNE